MAILHQYDPEFFSPVGTIFAPFCYVVVVVLASRCLTLTSNLCSLSLCVFAKSFKFFMLL